MSTDPVQTITTTKNGGTQRLHYFDGFNTDYVVVDHTGTVLGGADTWKGAALIQHTHGGRITLNGRDFILLRMDEA